MTRIFVRLAFIVLACACVFYMAAPSLAASSTIIKVDVLPGGDARWTTEKMVPLETPGDVAGWDATAAQNIDRYKLDFDGKMKEYVARISASVGRPMSVKDVNVSVDKSHPYALSDNGTMTYGVIRYEFTWTGFAMAGGDALEVGDAFVDGFLLNTDDVITFTLPAGFEVTGISPSPYDRKNASQPQVKWSGNVNGTDSDIRLFSSGEPSIILRKTSAPLLSLDWWMLIPVALASALLGFGAAYAVLKRQRPAEPMEIPPLPKNADLPDIEPSPGPDSSDGRFLSDEEKVIRFLEEAGGQMFQSDLVKKTDFSKSKLSMVLSVLKEKGVIIKIKKGKENLIRLNRPGKDGPGKIF